MELVFTFSLIWILSLGLIFSLLTNSLYESVFVETMRPRGKNIIVGCLYRPPDASLNDFNRSVEDILSAISFENKLSYIMGDVDIDILNSHSCSKPHRSSKSWFSNGLFTSCKKKNSLYKQFQLNPTALNKLRYNKYRNKYNFLTKLARKKFFHDKLLSVSSDLRRTWSVIKQIIYLKETEQLFNHMKDSPGSYSNPTQIATKFNNFLLMLVLLWEIKSLPIKLRIESFWLVITQSVSILTQLLPLRLY